MAPTAVIEMLNPYFPALAEIVFRYQGTLEKSIGDALQAIWGAPFAHPDDPERAVRAAVDMQRAIQGRVASGRQPGSLSVHIGVNSGVVAAGNIESEPYLQVATVGDATNVASRICSLAAAGEILLDTGTASRLGAGSALEPLGPMAVEGKVEPIDVVRVRWDGGE